MGRCLMFNESKEVWNVGHTGWVPQEIVHVPLILGGIKWGIKPKVDKELREGIDIAPTILNIVGIPVPNYMTGSDLRKSSP